MLANKKVFIFDKDDTITSTKWPIESDMASILSDLSANLKVIIISGSTWQIMQEQIISLLPAKANLSNWIFLSSGGSRLDYFKNGSFEKFYDEAISSTEFERIKRLLIQSLECLEDSEKPAKVFSEQVENRIGQITLSALGQIAPKELKVVWDHDRTKRHKMKAWLDARITSYDIKIGGSTSIDVTKKGVNKEFGVRKVIEFLDVSIVDCVYFGDSLEPGGNDAIVKNIAGLETIAVEDERETLKILQSSNLIKD